MDNNNSKIAPCQGKLGVLLPGMGAVSSTFIAGVELHKKKPGPMIGSVTQMQTIRLGKRYEGRRPLIRNFVQHLKLQNTLRLLMGEEVIDHSGLDYYDAEKGVPVAAQPPRPRKRVKAKTPARSK